MYSKFENIDPLKQERIINACMKEFAEKGYNNASTNEIVKSAQISKGILFHYFSNKKKLYLYMYDYTVEFMMKEYYATIDLEERDLFEKLEQIYKSKMRIVKRHPQATRFFELAYTEDSKEVKDEIEKRISGLKFNTYDTIFSNIDSSKFIEGVDISKVVNIVNCFFEGYGQQVLQISKLKGTPLDYDQLFEESHEYLQILKKCFYKNMEGMN